MTFTIEYGDLFTHPDQALAHGVNCEGVVGGLAAAMMNAYPDALTQYIAAARAGELEPGSALFTRNAGKDRVIIHCASQRLPGADATEGWLRSSLTAGLKLAADNGITSVALPLIGGGIGGLDPEVAQGIIGEVSAASPVAVTLVLQS